MTQLLQNVVSFQRQAQLPRDVAAKEGAAALAQVGGERPLQVAGAAIHVLLQRRRLLKAVEQLVAAAWQLPYK